jgi:hypothetical protein
MPANFAREPVNAAQCREISGSELQFDARRRTDAKMTMAIGQACSIVKLVWAGRRRAGQLRAEIESFATHLGSLGPYRLGRARAILNSEAGRADA